MMSKVPLPPRIGGGELFEKLANEDHVSEGQAASYTKQVLEALQHLHSLKIAHLDLKVCLGGSFVNID